MGDESRAEPEVIGASSETETAEPPSIAEAVDASTVLVASDQLMAMIVVDLLSTVFVIGVSRVALDEDHRLSFVSNFSLVAVVAVSAWLPVIAVRVWALYRRWRAHNTSNRGTPRPDVSQPNPNWLEPSKKVAVVLYSFWMIFHLAGLTRFSGGALTSPFAPLCVAVVLTAPYIANYAESAVAAWLVSMAAILAFSGDASSTVAGSHLKLAYGLTLGFSSAVSITIAIQTSVASWRWFRPRRLLARRPRADSPES